VTGRSEVPNAAASDEEDGLKVYAFALFTLNLTDQVRVGKNPFTGSDIAFHIDDPLNERQTAAVAAIFEGSWAAAPDDAGYRYLVLSNGTRVGLGGFNGGGKGIRSLPVEFLVKDRFSVPEASLTLKLLRAGNLFAGSTCDPDVVAVIGDVADARFYDRHKAATVTADELSLAIWVRKHIKSRAVQS
jgi:hypothetical protein